MRGSRLMHRLAFLAATSLTSPICGRFLPAVTLMGPDVAIVDPRSKKKYFVLIISNCSCPAA